MYNIICYNDNKNLVSQMHNYLSNDLNMIKEDITIQSYLLIYDYKIFGIFSFKNTTNSITIVLLKIVNILDKYIHEYIYKIVNNIVIDFDNIYIHKKNVQLLEIFIKELYNYKQNSTYIEQNNIILHYKKNYTYNYFNCLLF
tara:strand:+ start:821 stop:1246 length:426 start_codon:yes stop_codon:yes gene_type:complete